MVVDIRQAQRELAELVDRSSRGEEIIIESEDGHAAARLVSVSATALAPRPGFLKGKIEIVSDDDEHLKDFAEYM